MSDDYDAYDFPEFTEEDFRSIDTHVAHIYLNSASGLPAIKIELDPEPVTAAEDSKEPELSPLEAFRTRGILSVTDLTSLAWCEVQVDYGLRQRRSRPLVCRPDSFVSSSGKEIAVQKAVAVENDRTTKEGRAMHKDLEREVRVEEVPVDTTSDEERWALRFLNMMSCIEQLMLEGLTREMPVFGVIHDQVITGIIDEIVRKPWQPHTANGSLFPRNDSQHSDVQSGAHYSLHLIDTKTRRTNSLPSENDTLPSRLQLMLYHRLLDNLISSSSPFDFRLFYTKLDLHPSKPFSLRFIQQAEFLLFDSKHSRAILCLDDAVLAWKKLILESGIQIVDDNVQIIYRLQSRSRRRKIVVKTEGIQSSIHSIDFSQEEHDISKAIEASLQGPPSNTSERGPSTTADEYEDPPAMSEPTATVNGLGKDMSSEQSQAVFQAENAPDTPTIIGTKTFKVNPGLLEDYLVRAMEWWHGLREPEGVSIEDSGRCNSCEYSMDCEWRERKAKELAEKLQMRAA